MGKKNDAKGLEEYMRKRKCVQDRANRGQAAAAAVLQELDALADQGARHELLHERTLGQAVPKCYADAHAKWDPSAGSHRSMYVVC